MALTINSNTTGLNTTNLLQQAMFKKNSALQKLSSGLRINKGSDDPSGLVISELLRSQVSGYQRALRNTQETYNVMSIAEGGLSSMSSMLTQMKSLALHSLNSGITSGAQTSANQMELDSLLSSINRVVSTTNYAGNKLLDGSRDFSYSVTDASGMLSSASITNMSGSTASISASYSGSPSSQAERAYLEADFGDAITATAQDFTITGDAGSHSFSFSAGTSIEDMADQINQASGSTGVSAYAVRDQGSGATMLRLVSSDYGSSASVSVAQHQGNAFTSAGTSVKDYGQDATVSVNGSAVTTDGLTATVSGGGFSGSLTFDESVIGQTGYDQDYLVDANVSASTTISNITGGMQLQLGEGSGSQNRETISLGNYNPALLGAVVKDGKTYSLNDLYSGGAASLANDPELAMQIIDQAIKDVAGGRASIGAYQANALESNANNIMNAIENLTATESNIRDADMAKTISEYVRMKLLEEIALKGVQNANMNNDHVANLLGIM